MTLNQLYEMAESMSTDGIIALYKNNAIEDCTMCAGQGHSYDWHDDYVEPCECLDRLEEE